MKEEKKLKKRAKAEQVFGHSSGGGGVTVSGGGKQTQLCYALKLWTVSTTL